MTRALWSGVQIAANPIPSIAAIQEDAHDRDRPKQVEVALW